MRKAILVGSLIASIAAASPATAQSLPPDPGTWRTSIGGGVTFPVGSTGDKLKTGYHGALAVGYQLPDTKVELGLEGMYLRADNKLEGGHHSNVLVATAHAHWGFGGGFYLATGVGLLRDEYRTPLQDIEIVNTRASFAVEGGLGLDVGKHVFLEGRVIQTFRKAPNRYTLVPVTIGLRF
jgi:hypothetical protein